MTIETMARHTGVMPGRLRQMTFSRWLGCLIEEDDVVHKLPWLAPVGREASKKSFGQQLCPLCTAEAVPYFRMSWRLGFVTACPRHGVMLIDRCPDCGVPISPISGWNWKTGRIQCWRCDHSFAEDKGELVDPDDMAIQQALLDAAQAGWMELGDYGPVHSLAAFKILMLVFRLLASGRHALALRSYVASHWVHGDINYASIPRIREVEFLPPKCRQHLIRLTWALIQDWPHRFVEACRKAGPQSWDLIHGREVPFAFWHAVTFHLADPHRSFDDSEIAAAKELLERQGQVPDYRSLTTLTGAKIRPRPGMCQPANGHLPYGTGRYWKIDGVSAQVKDAVKMAARRDGKGVGLWLEDVLRKQLNLVN